MNHLNTCLVILSHLIRSCLCNPVIRNSPWWVNMFFIRVHGLVHFILFLFSTIMFLQWGYSNGLFGSPGHPTKTDMQQMQFARSESLSFQKKMSNYFHKKLPWNVSYYFILFFLRQTTMYEIKSDIGISIRILRPKTLFCNLLLPVGDFSAWHNCFSLMGLH